MIRGPWPRQVNFLLAATTSFTGENLLPKFHNFGGNLKRPFPSFLAKAGILSGSERDSKVYPLP
jgi:hypothetical protein